MTVVSYDKTSKVKFVAIYLRKSRNEEGIDDEEVLMKHRSQLLNFVESNGWKYDLFQEIGSSDTIEFRPEFKKLLERVRVGIYDAVVVVETDRITKGDTYEYGYIKRTFSESKTLIITPYNEVVDYSDEMNIMNDVKHSMFRHEYLQTKKRMREGKLRSARMGQWVNGTPPIGFKYDRDTKKLVIDEEKAKMVRLTFELYVKDKLSLNEVSFELNRRGYKGLRGKHFSTRTISRILTNEAYIGNIVFGKSEGSAHRNKKTKPHRALPEDEWIRVENAHPAIIDKETFNNAAIMMKRRQRVGKKARKERFTLTGLIRCAKCGKLMGFNKKPLARGGFYIAIRPCNKYDAFGNMCKCRGGKVQPVLQAIRHHIEDYRETLFDSSAAIDVDTRKRIEAKIEKEREEITRLELSIERIKTLFIDGFIDKDEMKKRTDLQNEKLNVSKNELRTLEIELSQVNDKTFERKVALIEKISREWDNDPENAAMNKALRELIEVIRYFRDDDGNIELEIEFY